MKLVLWLLALAGVAVALALFAGHNDASVTVFWSPYRLDLSLNLVIVVLVAAFALVHAVLRALSALLSMPKQAAQWRIAQRQRTMYMALVEALVQIVSGRFTRARKSAQTAFDQANALAGSQGEGAELRLVRAVAALLQAEAAHSLQDRSGRDELMTVLLQPGAKGSVSDVRDAALMRAARWDLDERDASASLARMDAMSQGAGRRTLTLKIRLKAQRLALRPERALETARLLIKHRAYSELAAASLTRSLVGECVRGARDLSQLMAVWNGLTPSERSLPECMILTAECAMALGGGREQARAWLMPLWARWTQLDAGERVRLVRAFDSAVEGLDMASLGVLESMQRGHPGDPLLQYICGAAFKQRELWGKAQAMLTQALRQPLPLDLARRAWLGLAELAATRGDETAERDAWRSAARADR